MYYYYVFVNDNTYARKTPLTYSSEDRLSIGSVVVAPLKTARVLGFLTREVARPNFITKSIEPLVDVPALPTAQVRLAEWLLDYYPAPVGTIAQQFLPKSLLKKHRLQHNTALNPLALTPLPPLTSEQKKAIRSIRGHGTFMLHGETGSGKTRIYIELARRALSQNRSAIIMTPEIALTPQIASTFNNAFGTDSVVVTHSQLTEGERLESWMRILKTRKPLLIIGPRSALFSPLAEIGLIVLDESHEPTYKQDQLPRYQTGIVAAKLASLHRAALVLGSATPSVTDYYIALKKERPILHMQKPARAEETYAAEIELVDMKDRRQFTASAYISNTLIRRLEIAFNRGEQSLLFLNRRGTARIVLCDKCGWQALCPHCNLPLTYHGDSHRLRCHSCIFSQQAMSSCPVCNNSNIVLRSVGTKAIVDEVTSILPGARIGRFDADNKKSERLEQVYESVRQGDIDVLVGTQILAKGLDLPKLSTVGVIAADSGLYLPDYTAQERTYQLLRQVIGRVGRGHTSESTVIVQTYSPENTAIQSAINNDWGRFYEEELDQRRKFMFPPFCFLLKLACRRSSSSAAQAAAEKLAQELHNTKLRIAVEGPTPSFHERIESKYQWQLIIKAKNRQELLAVVANLPSGWTYDIDPLNLL